MVSAPPPIALRKFFFPPPLSAPVLSPSLSRSQGQLLLIPLFKSGGEKIEGNLMAEKKRQIPHTFDIEVTFTFGSSMRLENGGEDCVICHFPSFPPQNKFPRT